MKITIDGQPNELLPFIAQLGATRLNEFTEKELKLINDFIDFVISQRKVKRK